MAILLALLSAIAYGTADFVGGVVSQKSSAWQAAVVVALVATVAAFPLALLFGGDPSGSDWMLGAAGGLASGFGSAFLYRGLSTARMSVVAPLSAVVTAVIPVAIGLALGERPSTLALVGIAIAVPAILLVAGGDDAADRSPGNPPITDAGPADGERAATDHAAHVHDFAHTHDPEAPRPRSSGIVDGLLAGTGFGLLFVTAGRIDENAGLAPTALLQLTTVIGVIAIASILREDWVPRQRAAWRAWIGGPLIVVAIVALMEATHHGLLSLVAVIASLYPAVTVLLAAVLLGERIGRLQAGGLVLAAAAVSLVAAG